MTTNSPATVKQINDYLEISTRFHKKGDVISNHWHDYFEFEMVLDGEYLHTVSGQQRTAKRGSGWIMSHLDYHSLQCKEDAILINISFNGEEIDSGIIDAISNSGGCFLNEFDEETTNKILNSCEKARAELLDKMPLWKSAVTSAVEDVLITAIRNASQNTDSVVEKMPRLLQSVSAHLHKNYKTDLSLSAVASKFSVSAGHLGMIFSKTFGISFNSYVTRIRLRHACNMLTSSNLSAKEIAFECGFSSVEYFFYVFKKNLSMTPGEYRESTEKIDI